MHIKQCEEIMSSVAFAEAGEIDSAIEILHERHKVLLVLTGEETDMKAARYALNICKRIRGESKSCISQRTTMTCGSRKNT
jgi:hypothetical protein